MSPQAERLAHEIERLYTLLVLRRGELGPGEERALTGTQRVALAAVVDRGPLRLGELAEQTGMTDPTATRTVDTLAALGLVERLPDPDDRRAIRVAATPRGTRLLGDRRARLVEVLRGPLARLPKQDQLRFVELFAELNGVLTGEARADLPGPGGPVPRRVSIRV